jgi:hypothetical protein
MSPRSRHTRSIVTTIIVMKSIAPLAITDGNPNIRARKNGDLLDNQPM